MKVYGTDTQNVYPEASEHNCWEGELSDTGPDVVILSEENCEKVMSIMKTFSLTLMDKVSPMDMQRGRLRQMTESTKKLIKLGMAMATESNLC